MVSGAGDRVLESTSRGWQESVATNSPGFTVEHLVVLGIFVAISLLMIARKRGWGSKID